MKLTEFLQLLVDVQDGRVVAMPGRYAVLVYGADQSPAAPEHEDDEDQASSVDFELVGEAPSLPAAMDHLGTLMAGWTGHAGASEIIPAGTQTITWFDDKTCDDVDLTAYFHALRAPARAALFACVAGYLAGPFYEITDEDQSTQDPYAHHVLTRFPGARFVFGMAAAPPNQGKAWCIVELQPTGALSARDRELHAACASGDVDALYAALALGAHIDGLDERGMAPLHVAVGHRKDGAAAALLAAGADASLQAGFGNAPQFAALGEDEQLYPTAFQVDDDAHWMMLQRLVEAGADVQARNTLGMTLVDLLLWSPAYPVERIAWLRARGAQSGWLRHDKLTEKLCIPPWGDLPALRRLVNQVRYLLEDGADANQPPSLGFDDRPLQSLIGSTGYSEQEIPGDILEELVALLLRHGAQDGPDRYGTSALQHAESWVSHGFRHYEAVVRLLQSSSS